jgi:hypothetical protein
MAEQYPLDVPAIAAAIASASTTLNASLAVQLGTSETPESLTAQVAACAGALSNIQNLLTNMLVKQDNIVASLVTLQSAVQTQTAIQTQTLTTQQLAVSDQIKNHQFQQLTTNTSRTAAGLPAIKLPTTTIADTIKNSMSEALTVQASVAAPAALTGATTAAISSATSFLSDAVNLPAIWLKIKGLAATTFGASEAAAASQALQTDTNTNIKSPGGAPIYNPTV